MQLEQLNSALTMGLLFKQAMYSAMFVLEHTSVVVTNAVGCLEYSTATVAEPLPLAVSVNTTNLSCYNVCAGEIDISATGGTPAIQYSVDNGASFSLLAEHLPGVCAGTHDIMWLTTVEPAHYSAQAMVFEPALLAASVDITDATCAGTCDGSISALLLLVERALIPTLGTQLKQEITPWHKIFAWVLTLL